MYVIIVTPGHPGPDRKSLPPALTAPYLAALATPYADTLTICDLGVGSFDVNAPTPDVAMFTTTMAQFEQVYAIARVLKERGSCIIFGGPYATLAYELDPRIQEIADCVVLGEGEQAIPAALTDYLAGNLQPTYSMPVDSLEGVPFSRLDLLDNRNYYSTTAVIGTRGCTNNCTYCSIRDMYGQKYLKRPVDEVIAEIKYQTSRPGLSWLDRKLVEFWDDNPACDLEWFHELLEKLIPLKKWWLSQMCLNIADNPETVKLMRASGCKGIFVGIESVSEATLKSQKKETINSIDNYIHQAGTLLKNRINIIGAMMYGFDQDTEESLFVQTPELLEKIGITLLQSHIVTPYPHSEYYQLLDKENRLITKDAKYYNGYTIAHKPRQIHPAVLQKEFINSRKQFYSFPSILKRMLKHHWTKIPEFLIWNALFYKPNYESIQGVDIGQWLKKLEEL
jgi:radical SAM superfamily enzyme YgiQ (UPF0313 family)